MDDIRHVTTKKLLSRTLHLKCLAIKAYVTSENDTMVCNIFNYKLLYATMEMGTACILDCAKFMQFVSHMKNFFRDITKSS